MAKKYVKSNSSKRSRNTRKQANRWVIGLIAAVVLIGMGAIALQQNQNIAKAEPVETSQDKSMGEIAAPVVVVEYGDYQCPACGRFASTVKPKIVEEFVKTGQVRFVFRSFQFIGEESQWAAEAAECANEQGKYWEYYEKVYSKQAGENAGAFRKEKLVQFAAEIGLQTESFNQCLASGKFTEKVKAETLEAQKLGLRSTPSLLVNGKLVEGGAQYEILSQKIREALAKSK
ncbi:MAG: DsbA family protein [Chloroflexi bacterium]|nr:DsbA family protein [Chloroflexota bacterium]